MKGKHMVIVGGSSGIGLALAKQAVQLGAKVTIASRSATKLAAASEEISAPIVTYQLDATEQSEVKRFFSEVGPIDHLVATIKPAHIASSFMDAEIDLHHAAFTAKYWGQYYLAVYAMRSHAVTSSITFTSGIAASRGYPGFSGTAAINGAIEALVKSLAVELAPIRVNAVSPGFIERHSNDSERYAALVKLGSQVPLQRLGGHVEVAQGYLFVMNNQYTTGTVLTIDGGELCS